MHPRAARLAAVLVTVSLAACGGTDTRHDSAPGSTRIPDLPGDAIPKAEARSRYGNGPEYEVFGKQYTVLSSSAGYQERGVASWYGTKFHGNRTSNGDTYDMYQMTAAHKTLPLPTFVRVRNLQNNKTIIVRVNDRGPFVHNRVIDLSYVAALKLDMVRSGTSLVEVTAISFDAPAGNRPTRHVIESPPPAIPASASTTASKRIYVQVGAFGESVNAERRLRLLASAGIAGGLIYTDQTVSPTLFRVRIGPIADVVQFDVLVEELETLGISDPYLITE
ncbi:MAG: septal ring lytic transglycosylase RlpA family protein [Proteobacteria bacterium]|nr:septal ring lytic transglycosylase RlpA family protein [Pseudomonadota bacterium]